MTFVIFFKKRKRQDTVTKKQYNEHRRGKKTRLCGDLSKFLYHVHSYVPCNKRICAYCGEDGASIRCTICNDVPLHHKTGRANDGDCDIRYHNDVMFGLAKCDRLPLLNKNKNEWTKPTKQDEKENAELIKSFGCVTIG